MCAMALARRIPKARLPTVAKPGQSTYRYEDITLVQAALTTRLRFPRKS